MLQISVAPRSFGFTAFDRNCPEYAEDGKTADEAIGKLIRNQVENDIIDTIEFNYIDESDMRSEAEIERRLNGEI